MKLSHPYLMVCLNRIKIRVIRNSLNKVRAKAFCFCGKFYSSMLSLRSVNFTINGCYAAWQQAGCCAGVIFKVNFFSKKIKLPLCNSKTIIYLQSDLRPCAVNTEKPT